MTALRNLVTPLITRELKDVHLERLTVEVYFCRETTAMVMCEVVVSFNAGGMDELWEAATQLGMFGANNDPPLKVGKQEWFLGDGDDPLSVFFRNGAIRIWLRHWPKGQ